jgi:hypothetical protein
MIGAPKARSEDQRILVVSRNPLKRRTKKTNKEWYCTRNLWKADVWEEITDAAKMQQLRKELRPKRAATYRKQEGIQEDHQAGSQTAGREVSSRVFHHAAENKWLNTVEDSAPTQTEKETTSGLHASAVGAHHSHTFSPSKLKEWWHTNRLHGTSSLKDEAMCHTSSKQERWSQRNNHC